MPRGHLFTVCFQSHAGRAEMPNGLALSLSQENARRTAHALPTSLRPIGCSSGARADGIQARGVGGGDLKGRARAKGWRVCVCVCCLCPSVHSTCHPETAHASLGCQDNGQQARAVTPHFLCTELSNHDRCRQCHRRHYQGPLHFLPAWPRCRHTARVDEERGSRIHQKGARLPI